VPSLFAGTARLFHLHAVLTLREHETHLLSVVQQFAKVRRTVTTQGGRLAAQHYIAPPARFIGQCHLRAVAFCSEDLAVNAFDAQRVRPRFLRLQPRVDNVRAGRNKNLGIGEARPLPAIQAGCPPPRIRPPMKLVLRLFLLSPALRERAARRAG
jgi:hypothetical protein